MRFLSSLVLAATLFQIASTEQPPPPPSDTYHSHGKRGAEYRRERSLLSPSSAPSDHVGGSSRVTGNSRGGRRTSSPISPLSSSGGDEGFTSSLRASVGSAVAGDISSISTRRDGEAGSSDDDVMVLSRGIRFRPEGSLSIESPVCLPVVSEFWVDNVLGSDIHLYSVTSSSTQFHPVTFQAQALAPHDSMSIQLLFLPYHIRSVNATVTIVTSVGDFTYNLVGVSTSNPYGLRPFIGNRIISGVPLEVPIVMRNPHADPLRIREIFTTEEFLSLHSGSKGGSGSGTRGTGNGGSGDDEEGGVRGGAGSSAVVQKDGESSIVPSVREADQWLIEPGVEKEVISLSMSSSSPGHYFGYVHIKTDADKIVIPVDLLVLEGGLLPVDSVLDFGILTSSNAQKTIDFRVVNSGSSDISILEIVPTNPDTQLRIDMGQSRVKAGEQAIIASLTYTGSKVGKFQNKLLVMTNHSNAAYASFEASYEVSVLRGGIGLMFNDSVFYLPVWNRTSLAASQLELAEDGKAGYEVRKLVLTNYFSAPLTLQGVAADTCNEAITVTAMPEILIANKMDRWGPVTLVYNLSNAIHISSSKEGLPFTCWLELWTNISSHRIPLHIMDGDVTTKLLNDKGSKRRSAKYAQLPVDPDNFDSSYIDFKTLSISSPEGLLFSAVNRNPRKIPFYLSGTSEPVCVCVEQLVDMNEIEESQPLFDIDHYYPYKFVPHKNSGDNKCTCYNSNSRAIDGSASLDSDDGEVVDGSISSIEEPIIDANYEDPSVKFKPFVRIPSGYAALLSVHMQSILIGPSTFYFNWTSPYQSKTFVVDYIGVTGGIHADISLDEESITSFIVGNRQRINVVARSTFPYEVNLKYIETTSKLFWTDLSSKHPSIPSAGADPIIIGSLTPKFSCLPEKPTKSSKKSQKKKPAFDPWNPGYWEGIVQYPYWRCIYTLFSTVTNKTAPHLMNMITEIHAKLLDKNYAAAHESTLNFQAKWDRMFSNGLLLKPFDNFVTTDVTLNRIEVPELHVSLPTEMTPPVASVVMPPVKTGEDAVYFIRVLNPFDIDVSFRIVDSETPVFSPGIVSVLPSHKSIAELEDSPFIPAAYPKGWIPASCRDPSEYVNDANVGDQFAGGMPSQTIKSADGNSGAIPQMKDFDMDTLFVSHLSQENASSDIYSLLMRSRWYSSSRNKTHQEASSCGANNVSSGWCGAQTASTFVFPDACSTWIHSLLRQGVETYPIVWGVHVAEYPSAFSNSINWGENPSSSPFHLGDITHNEIVVSPGAFTLLGPILFRPEADGMYEKNIFIINSFFGTEKVSISAESGSMDLRIERSAFVAPMRHDANSSARHGLYVSGLENSGSLKNDSCARRFISDPTDTYILQYASGLIRSAIFNDTPSYPDDTSETLFAVTGNNGFVEIQIANEGIMRGEIGSLEINGVAACSQDSAEVEVSSPYHNVCTQFPLRIEGCSSINIFIPHELYCGATRSAISIRLYSPQKDGRRTLLLDTSLSTVLSPDMQRFCHDSLDLYYSTIPQFQLLQRIIISFSIIMIATYLSLFLRYKRREDANVKSENAVVRSSDHEDDLASLPALTGPEKRPRSHSRQGDALAPMNAADILLHVPDAQLLGGDAFVSTVTAATESTIKQSKGLSAYRKFTAKRREVISQALTAPDSSRAKKKPEETVKPVAKTVEPEKEKSALTAVKDNSVAPAPRVGPKTVTQKEAVVEISEVNTAPVIVAALRERAEETVHPTSAKAAMKPSPSASKASKSPGTASAKTSEAIKEAAVAVAAEQEAVKDIAPLAPVKQSSPPAAKEVEPPPKSKLSVEISAPVSIPANQLEEMDLDDSLDLNLIADLVKLPTNVRTPEPVKPHSLLNKESPSGNMSILYQGIYGSPGDGKRGSHVSAPPPGFQKREEVPAVIPTIPIIDNRVPDRGNTPRIAMPQSFRPETVQPQLKKNISDSSIAFDEKFVDDLLLSPMASDGVFSSTESTSSLFGGTMNGVARDGGLVGSTNWNSAFRSPPNSLPDYDIFKGDAHVLGVGLLGNPSSLNSLAPASRIDPTPLPTASLPLGFAASAPASPAPAPSGGHQRLLEVTYDNVRDVLSYNQQQLQLQQYQRSQYGARSDGLPHRHSLTPTHSHLQYSSLDGDFLVPGSRMGASGINMNMNAVNMSYPAQGGRGSGPYAFGGRTSSSSSSSGLQYYEEKQSSAAPGSFSRGSGAMGGPMSAPYVPSSTRTHTVLGAQLRQLEDSHLESVLSNRYSADYPVPLQPSMSHGRSSSPRFGLSPGATSGTSSAPSGFTRTSFSPPTTDPGPSPFGMSGFFVTSHASNPLLDTPLEEEEEQ